jgi:hypothetical protein
MQICGYFVAFRYDFYESGFTAGNCRISFGKWQCESLTTPALTVTARRCVRAGPGC